MSVITKVKYNVELKHLARKLKYRKHDAILKNSESEELTGTYWSGGSRSSYVTYNIKTNTLIMPEYSTDPPEYGGGAPRVYEMKPDIYLVKVGTFCGKPATMQVYGLDAEEVFGEELDNILTARGIDPPK